MKTDTLYDTRSTSQFQAPIQKLPQEVQHEEENSENPEWDTTTLDFGDGKPLVVTFPVRD